MRRNRLDLMKPAERSIYDALQEVEKIGADPKLTEAVVKLQQAKDLVSDFIDAIEYNQTGTNEFEDDDDTGGSNPPPNKGRG